ncbi:glutathione S-transferase 1 [Drosophila takahashii]|uniref:glutathione S-transferase 1 n=1 Tax=Drosophila takahashii TaxID=29030 RepID=UPI001CF84A4C|nr:glutathione S-transferase 1-like [Drosophila takahashii]XP_044249290.1 glutathione S-transferase 1-like [Drosophila takahashii]
MTGVLVLYGMDISPPVRACKLTLRALNLDYEYKEINLLEREHLSEDFLKKNPQHTVPLLDDNGTFIWDSHAIVCYLVDKYGKSDELYPRDLVKRARVDQRLFFDASILFMSLRNVSLPYFYHQVNVVPKEKVDSIKDAYGHLETFLGDNPYLTGSNITLADFCCAATASALAAVLELDQQKYPKVAAWLKRLSSLPHYEEDSSRSLEKYINMLKPGLKFEQ